MIKKIAFIGSDLLKDPDRLEQEYLNKWGSLIVEICIWTIKNSFFHVFH